MTTKAIFTAVLVVCFFALMIGVGLYCRRRAKTVDDFVLGGRAVGPWLTAFAFGTSYFSAVIFVGYAGQFGWNFGLASTWIGLGNAFIGSLLAWLVLGKRTRIMTQSINSKTMPDFFEKRFGSSKLKVVASAIVFVFLIPYTASLYNGLSSLFNIAFSVPYWVCILVMAILTGIYVVFGGYMATAINDFIQGIIMLAGIVAVVVAVLMQHGGLVESAGLLATKAGAKYTSLFGPDPMSLVTVVLLTSLGTWGLPQMIGKFYAIADDKAVKKGTIISTVFAIVVAGGCYFLGGFGRLFVNADGGKPVTGFDGVVPSMLSELPDIIIAIVIVLVLSASMSTLSSLVLTSASTLTLDVFAPIFKKKGLTEKKNLIIMRMLIVFFILLSAVIAILKDTVLKDVAFIAQMMGISWGALAGSFLAPFLYGLYWKRTTRVAVWCSFAFGATIMITQLVLSLCGAIPPSGFFHFVFQSSLYTGVIAMLGGLVIVPIVSLLTQKSRPANVEEIFTCYKK